MNEKTIQEMIGITGIGGALLTNVHTGKKQWIPLKNIVTDAGDLYAAERYALLTSGTPIGPVPTNFTDANGVPDMIMELYDDSTPNTAPGKGNDRSDLNGVLATGSDQVIDATYPQPNDPDPVNTGAGTDIVTYRVSYATGDANLVDITDVILTNPSPGASEPILMHAEFGAAFTKTSADTLKVFVNHRMNGV